MTDEEIRSRQDFQKTLNEIKQILLENPHTAIFGTIERINVRFPADCIASKDAIVQGDILAHQNLFNQEKGINLYVTSSVRACNIRLSNGNLYIEKDMKISNNINIEGSVWVNGNLIAGNDLIINGDLLVNGDIIAKNNIDIKGNVNITGKIISENGNIIIRGDVNAGKSIESANDIIILDYDEITIGDGKIINNNIDAKHIYGEENITFEENGYINAGENVNIFPDKQTARKKALVKKYKF